MRGLMMDYQLTVPAMVRRAEQPCRTDRDCQPHQQRPDSPLHLSRHDRARQASWRRLAEAGVAPGDRVGTLCANHYQHLEAYFGVPSFGAVWHTLNPRLSADDLAYVINHASDRALVVDWHHLPPQPVHRQARRGHRHRRRRERDASFTVSLIRTAHRGQSDELGVPTLRRPHQHDATVSLNCWPPA